MYPVVSIEQVSASDSTSDLYSENVGFFMGFFSVYTENAGIEPLIAYDPFHPWKRPFKPTRL
jgi:hypothetical protein